MGLRARRLVFAAPDGGRRQLLVWHPGSPGRHPLVLFNHGGALAPDANRMLMQALAGQGHVLASVAHPGESADLAWDDGSRSGVDPERLAQLTMQGEPLQALARFHLAGDEAERRRLLPALEEGFRNSLTAATARWAVQTLDALAQLQALAAAGDPLMQAIDFERRAYAGMSLGGSVAVECCFRDPSARACINLDGMNWNFDRVDQDLPAAMLQLYADPTLLRAQVRAIVAQTGPPREHDAMPNDFFYEPPERRGLRADVVRLVVPGAGHMAFTDHGGAAFNAMLAGLCGAFLDEHLRGNADPGFAQALAACPGVARQRPLRRALSR